MKTFEEVPAGDVFARRDGHRLDHETYSAFIKLREPFRWDVPDGSGFMQVNAIKLTDGSYHSVNQGEPAKKAGLLLAIRTFATLRRKSWLDPSMTDGIRVSVTMGLFPETIQKVKGLRKLLSSPTLTETVKIAVWITFDVVSALKKGQSVKINGNEMDLSGPGVHD